jgi:leukotriene-A4 hydrolase
MQFPVGAFLHVPEIFHAIILPATVNRGTVPWWQTDRVVTVVTLGRTGTFRSATRPAVSDCQVSPRIGRGLHQMGSTKRGQLLRTLAALGVGLVTTQSSIARDLHSYSTPEVAVVRHLSLGLTVDFATKTLGGTALLTIERKAPGPLVLDTRDLTIESVRAGATRQSLAKVDHSLKPADPILGSALEIAVPDGATFVEVVYKTSPKASALQWLDPGRTAGGKAPFLFTQSEAIHARSWIPLQDPPGVRITYSASIAMSENLVAVMSADQGVTVFNANKLQTFQMKEPIPPYLIALAVGDLEFRPIGKRTGVWAEPSVVEKAANEFVDTEKMVEAAEALFGPYRWVRYDILVLPPSFPFGGMENPKLTFATPTVIAGDRSLVSLIAHELAHSWSGNLVTNATWRDFWLNEGFTTYGERRIVEAIYSPEVAGVEWRLGFLDLKEELASHKPADQILHVDLTGRDPDDGMTRIPYEKGALFLVTVEHAFGRPAFDRYLRGYFDRNAFKSITTADFVADLKTHLFATNAEAAAKIDLDAWIEQPGLKGAYTEPVSPKLAQISRAAKAFVAAKDLKAESANWTTHEWLQFLRALPETLTPAQMADLDATFGLTARGNSEIAAQWLLMAIRNRYAPADARLETFLTTIGRRKFLMPLYKELVKTDAGKARARAIYAKARPFYHPIAVESVDKVIGKP